jgi:hypothetical protein
LKGHCPLLLNPPSCPQSIFEAIQAIGPAGWPLSSACWTRSPEIAQAILDGKALSVADGSYMEKISKKHGAAAWLVQECEDSPLYCQGQVDTSGNTNEVSSYRSELQGVHSLLMAIIIICQVYNIKSWSITLACDNEVAIRLSNDGCVSVPPLLRMPTLSGPSATSTPSSLFKFACLMSIGTRTSTSPSPV